MAYSRAMNTLNPQVSVLMSVYNSARYLRESVESILNQTFTDFEFLITDDGSEDTSIAILQEYASHDPRIRLISHENWGLTRTLNQMLKVAKGELIARMDADDIAFPDRLERQVKFLQAHPEVVCLGGSHELIDEKGRTLIYSPVPAGNEEIQKLLLGGTSTICHPCAMMRREAMLQVGGYDETLKTSQDLDLFLKLGEIGELANINNAFLLKFRMHKGSVSQRKIAQQGDDARKACEAAWQRRNVTGQFTRKTWSTDTDRESLHDFLMRCGWSMFNHGHRTAAISYGVRASMTLPLCLDGWTLLLCALIKPLPKPESL